MQEQQTVIAKLYLNHFFSQGLNSVLCCAHIGLLNWHSGIGFYHGSCSYDPLPCYIVLFLSAKNELKLETCLRGNGNRIMVKSI